MTTVRWLGRAGAALFVLVSLTDALYAFTEPGRGLTLVPRRSSSSISGFGW